MQNKDRAYHISKTFELFGNNLEIFVNFAGQFN